MKGHNYDIFISYRRDSGAQYARILQLMLIQRGYSVFLDYDELTDGKFGEHIVKAIKDAPIFILMLSSHSLERCKNENDWVRHEIELALAEKKKIIPVNPDNSFDGVPDDIPEAIREAAGSHQHSDISFGQTLGVTVDFMIEKRIAPLVGHRSKQNSVDTDFDAAKLSLEKMDAHHRFMKKLAIAGVVLFLLLCLSAITVFGYQYWKTSKSEKQRTELERKYKSFGLQFSPAATDIQLLAVDDILSKMSCVCPDTLWLSRFECTVGQYNTILGIDFDEALKDMPKTEISYGEVYMYFIDSLNKIAQMDNFEFRLPSVEEWVYAAHGGPHRESTLYVGSDRVDEVAWFQENSRGKVHASDGQQGKSCNWLDLFDMSGNVGEWCNSHIITENGTLLMAVCGGNYNSPATEVTAESKVGMDAGAQEKTVGFRLAIGKK